MKYLSDKRLFISMEQVTVLQTYPVMVAGDTSDHLNINITGIMVGRHYVVDMEKHMSLLEQFT